MLEVHAFILAQEKETNKVFIKKLYIGQKSVLFFVFNAHAVERAIDKVESDDQEDDTYPRSCMAESFADGNFHSQNTKEGGEFDDGVQSH